MAGILLWLTVAEKVLTLAQKARRRKDENHIGRTPKLTLLDRVRSRAAKERHRASGGERRGE